MQTREEETKKKGRHYSETSWCTHSFKRHKATQGTPLNEVKLNL